MILVTIISSLMFVPPCPELGDVGTRGHQICVQAADRLGPKRACRRSATAQGFGLTLGIRV